MPTPRKYKDAIHFIILTPLIKKKKEKNAAILMAFSHQNQRVLFIFQNKALYAISKKNLRPKVHAYF